MSSWTLFWYWDKKIGSTIKPSSDNDNSVVVFDDLVGRKGCHEIDQFCVTGKQNNLDIYFLSQSYFE